MLVIVGYDSRDLQAGVDRGPASKDTATGHDELSTRQLLLSTRLVKDGRPGLEEHVLGPKGGVDNAWEIVVVATTFNQKHVQTWVGRCETPGDNAARRTTAHDNHINLVEVFRERVVQRHVGVSETVCN